MLRRFIFSLSAVTFLAASALAWHSSTSIAWGQYSPVVGNSPASMRSGFEGRCATCHDNTAAGNRAPSREAMAAMTAERVLESITTGSMAIYVEGWNEENLLALAELAAAKPFGDAADRTAAAMSNPCTSPLTLHDPFSRPRWNGWTPDPGKSHRFQPAEAGGLTGAQVSQLKLKWAFAIPDAASASWAQPTVVGGALFIGSDNKFVYALDAKTGCVHWSYEARGQVRTAVSVSEVTDVPEVRYIAMFGDYRGYVTGVNAETGEELWVMRPDEHAAAKITGTPVLDPSAGGHLYVGVASWEELPSGDLLYECCQFQGSVVAVDVSTGQTAWKTYSMSERPRPLRKNSAGTQMYGPAGASVWNAPTLDIDHRTLYAAAGNCYMTEFFEQHVGFDDGTCAAVTAYDMDTGERLWWRQLVALERFGGGCGRQPEERRINCPGLVTGSNDDASGSPVLHTLEDGRRILIQGQESGRITAMDPDNQGEILWVAQAGNELAMPSAGFGGAFDGEYYLKPFPLEDGRGGLAALRAEDGSRAWYTEVPKPSDCEDPESGQTCHSGHWAPATAIPGAVLAGSRDGVMRAFSTEDGSVMWEFATQRDFETINGVKGFGGGFGGAAPSIVDGMMYVGSGYAILRGSPGNVLLAFGLE